MSRLSNNYSGIVQFIPLFSVSHIQFIPLIRLSQVQIDQRSSLSIGFVDPIVSSSHHKISNFHVIPYPFLSFVKVYLMSCLAKVQFISSARLLSPVLTCMCLLSRVNSMSSLSNIFPSHFRLITDPFIAMSHVKFIPFPVIVVVHYLKYGSSS